MGKVLLANKYEDLMTVEVFMCDMGGGGKAGGGKGRRAQEGRWKEKRRRKVLVVTNHLCYQLLCTCVKIS